MDGVLGWLAVIVAVVIGADSFGRARTLEVGRAEERVFRVVNDAPGFVHIPVWAVMQAGSLAAVFVVGAGLVLLDERPQAGFAVVIGTVVWAGVKRAKHFVGRGRPGAHLREVNVRGQAQSGLGYPSGHAAVSLTLALIATQGMSVGVQLAAIGVALFTGGARMYVGAHLPIDVVGGLSIGIIFGTATNLAVTAWG